MVNEYAKAERFNDSNDTNNNILFLNISSDDGEKDKIHSVIEELEVPSALREWYKSEEEVEMMRGHIGGAAFYHCDGIICLVCVDGTMLWNPALRESKLLPKSSFDHDGYMDIGKAGFGYDSLVNDYKVLSAFPYDELPDCKDLLAGRTLKVWTDSIAFVTCCGYYGSTISIKM